MSGKRSTPLISRAATVVALTGARPKVINETDAVDKALAGEGPVFLVGELALQKNATVRKALDKVIDPDPYGRNDAIVAAWGDGRKGGT